MYAHLIVLHSAFRWLVLFFLLLALWRAYTGYFHNRTFTKADNSIRHWTATVAHLQLLIGITLYIKSPTVQYLWANLGTALKNKDAAFFGLYHFLLMFLAVFAVTIGSAMAKRKPTDREKFRTMLVWFGITLLIIFIAIPWPFSPLASRPYIRTF